MSLKDYKTIDMLINNDFEIGDNVVVKTDKKGRRYIVTEIYISEAGITYRISNHSGERTFWGYELEPWVENVKSKPERGNWRYLTVPYLKSLEYNPYIRLLDANEVKIVRDILQMLVGAEEYEMAEVTKRYLDRRTLTKKT